MKNTILIITPQDKKVLNQVLDYASRELQKELPKNKREFTKQTKMLDTISNIKECLQEK